MRNHSELFQAIKTGTQLAQAAEFISKTEAGYQAKIAGLWVKTGEAIAENGSLQTANKLLAELKAFYPANRLGEKAQSIAKAAQAKGMQIHYYQALKGTGNPSAFHANPKALTATEQAKQLKQVIKVCEKDAKRAEKDGDKVELKVVTELKKEFEQELLDLHDDVKTELAEKAAEQKANLLQRVYDALMADLVTDKDLEKVILAATADKLAAIVADDQAKAA